MEANLSRIHHLIKNTLEEFDRISNRIYAMRLEFNFQVFEKTEEADFQQFCERLAKRRQEYTGLRKRMKKLLDYSDYLKMKLAAANEKYGISARLTRVASLGRQIRHQSGLLSLVREKHALDLEPACPMDVYKSSFTEKERIFNLPVYLFNEKDLEDMRAEYRRLLKEQQAINDDVATLNQTHSLEILTFEEFSEKGGEQLIV